MNRLQIITGWNGAGTSLNPYRPALADDHPVSSWVDKTNANPLLGGTYTIEAICDNATLAAIQADPRYNQGITILPMGP